MFVNIQIMKIVNAEKNQLIVDECTETIEEVKIAKRNLAENENKKKNKNAVLAL